MQSTSAFSRFVDASVFVAFEEKAEVEGCRYKEPRPLVVLSKYLGLLLLKNRLRLRDVVTESLSL